MKKLLFPVILAAVLITFLASCVKDDTYVPPTVGDSDIVLNEVMSKDPVTDLDWIELYNKSEAEADISGYLLNDAADPSGGYALPAGTKIAAKGYLVVHEADFIFGISSGGEDLSFGKPDGTVLDLTTVPASQADGTTYSRLPDGGEVWANGTIATPGAANIGDASTPSVSDIVYNIAPAAGEVIDVEITFASTETVSEVAVFYATGDAPVYNASNKLIGALGTGTATVTMTDLNVANEKVSFFVAITLDDASVYYYDKDNRNIELATISADPGLWETYTAVAGGVAAPIVNISFSPAPTAGDNILVGVDYSADIEITEARIYFAYGDAPAYLKANKISGEDDTSFTQDGVILNIGGLEVLDPTDGTTVLGNVGDAGAKISFYVRLQLVNGNEYYYDKDGTPILDTDDDGTDDGPSDDFKDDPTQWNTFTPKAAVSVTKFDFPANPSPTGDILLDIEYSSTETIEEARIYYAIGDSPVYIKDNKIKGEDDASFTQTGVTINMRDIDIIDADDVVVGTTSDPGAKISFYLRIATPTSEYYFALGSLAAIDDTKGGSIFDESDAFKADPTLWNVYNVQSSK